MNWRRFRSIRSRLVFRYLAVLLGLLAGLGIFQTLTLRQYLQSNAASVMRQAAYSELRWLTPCYVQTSADLRAQALSLAMLLGSHDTAVKIVDARGGALADHGYGPPGKTHSLQLSAATIRQLISPWNARSGTVSSSATQECRSGLTTPPSTHVSGSSSTPPPHVEIAVGSLILTSVPIGPFDHPLGFALLGRPGNEEATILRRIEAVFVIGALVTLVVAALVAWPVISRALRPLHRVAVTARAIADGDLDRRTNLSSQPDEIGVLGGSFDTMVDRLQSALGDANASEERMREFLADASHELRTPITVLRGMSEVLLRQSDREPPARTKALRDLHLEAIRLSRLVDDLLTLSRLDSGAVAAGQPIEARPFLHEFMHRYADAWPDRQIELRSSGLNGAYVQVDPDALRRVLLNLVDNAARYSAPAGPITLSGEERADEVILSVTDAGPGLEPQDAARVFERFYRTGASRARSSGGTGLGLPIVKSLVEGNGGRVRMNTGPDRGTTVSVTLPRTAPVPRPVVPV